jgi:hypothetical protein
MTDMPTPEPALRSVIAHINALIEDLISPLGMSRPELWGILRSFGLLLRSCSFCVLSIFQSLS